jgi:hypothetical protein
MTATLLFLNDFTDLQQIHRLRREKNYSLIGLAAHSSNTLGQFGILIDTSIPPEKH